MEVINFQQSKHNLKYEKDKPLQMNFDTNAQMNKIVWFFLFNNFSKSICKRNLHNKNACIVVLGIPLFQFNLTEIGNRFLTDAKVYTHYKSDINVDQFNSYCAHGTYRKDCNENLKNYLSKLLGICKKDVCVFQTEKVLTWYLNTYIKT